MKKEPVLILLAGLAGLINLGLIAANAIGTTHLDGSQIAAVVAFVTSACALAASVLRAYVSPAS